MDISADLEELAQTPVMVVCAGAKSILDLGLTLEYLETKDKQTWYTMIQLLPSSYNQMRTCTLNYETLANIYFARRSHKLEEWHTYCDWALELPYFKTLIADTKD